MRVSRRWWRRTHGKQIKVIDIFVFVRDRVQSRIRAVRLRAGKRQVSIRPFAQVDSVRIDQYGKVYLSSLSESWSQHVRREPYLDEPPDNDNCHSGSLLFVPNSSRSLHTLFRCHAGIATPSSFHDLLLSWRRNLLLAIMRSVNPPHDCKEYHPSRG